MNTKRTDSDEIFDILLRNALIARYENEISELTSELPQYDTSKKFKKNIKKIRRNINIEETIKKFFHHSTKVIIISFSIIGIFFSGLLTQSEVYAAVEKVIRRIFSTHDSYTYEDTLKRLEFNKDQKLMYLPEDFEIRSIVYSDNNVFSTYEDSNELVIYFSYGLAEFALISIDNEQHSYNEIDVNDIIYYFYNSKESNGKNSLIWYKEGYYYSLDAQLSVEELVKIAENVK